MFNGIIYNQGKIIFLKRSKNSIILDIKTNLRFMKNDIGSSVSCNGTCLTIISVKGKIIRFYLSIETLSKTNFKNCKLGDFINLEKSLKYGSEISGHYLQGHIDTVGKIKKITIIDKTWLIKIFFSNKFRDLIVEKGSIGINGVSLTVSNLTKDTLMLSVIPHTLKLTNLLNLKKNDLVNIELDIFGKYLKKITN